MYKVFKYTHLLIEPIIHEYAEALWQDNPFQNFSRKSIF